MMAPEIEMLVDEEETAEDNSLPMTTTTTARATTTTSMSRRRRLCLFAAVLTIGVALTITLIVVLVEHDDDVKVTQPTTAKGTVQDEESQQQQQQQQQESPPPKEDYLTWWEQNVTLESGVMYEVVEQLSHDENAFTQGLTYWDGALYESTGQYGESSLRQLDPRNGSTLVSIPLEGHYFGEGLTFYNDTLIQITWQESTAFVWNASDLSIAPKVIFYETTNSQGWGITYDMTRNELIVSDGSANVVFWDPETLEILRTLPITRQNGQPASNLNELEFWRDRVLANVWFEDVLLVIHPETGKVEKEYDFSQLWPESERPYGTNVLNGISISQDPDILYITGKYWNRIYKIKLLP